MSDNSGKLKNQVSVGKVRDSHGLKGELFIMTNLTEPPPWLSELKEFTLKFKSPDDNGKHEDHLAHFNVIKIRPHKKGFIVKSEGIDDRNESDKYKGAVFYIAKTYLETEKGDKIYLHEVRDFITYNRNEAIGTIVGFVTNTVQDLIVIDYKNEKVEIPFVEQFIQKIDWENKKVYLDLPEGLLPDEQAD